MNLELKFFGYLKHESVDSINFFKRSAEVIVTLHTVEGFHPVGVISVSNYVQLIRGLMRFPVIQNSETGLFEPGNTVHQIAVSTEISKSLIKKPITITHVPNRQGFIATICKTVDEEELKQSFYSEIDNADVKKQKSQQAKSDLAEISTCEEHKNDNQAFEEMTNDAKKAQARFSVATNEFVYMLNNGDYKEFEIRRDPLSDILSFGLYTGYVLPDSFRMIEKRTS